jgi:hypothetical protein
MDFLDKQRYIPRFVKLSSAEMEEFVEKKLCKTCKNYDFYYCRHLNVDTAPERECTCPEEYVPSELYRESVKHSDSEEAPV